MGLTFPTHTTTSNTHHHNHHHNHVCHDLRLYQESFLFTRIILNPSNVALNTAFLTIMWRHEDSQSNQTNPAVIKFREASKKNRAWPGQSQEIKFWVYRDKKRFSMSFCVTVCFPESTWEAGREEVEERRGKEKRWRN